MTRSGIILGMLLGGCIVMAQNPNSGTVNSMSTDPQQNQKMTGSMGTTTGQPNDVTPGSGAANTLGYPSDRTMTGSDSNGTYQQTPATNKNSKQGKTAKRKPAAKKDSNAPQP